MRAAVAIAPMASADLDRVIALELSIYDHPWTRGNFADSLASGYGAWLATVGDEFVGYAVMSVAADEAQLLNISVAPTQQRHGIGSGLLAHLRAVAATAGGRRLFLEVRRSNAGAQAFYQHHGFFQIGERRGYYPAADSREDAIVMELPL